MEQIAALGLDLACAAIDLACAALQGQINANSTLFTLSHMQSLNLAFNDFSNSHIPSPIGQFVNLTHLISKKKFNYISCY